MFSDGQLNQLRAPLDEQRVSIRKVQGRSLSYLETWDCIAKANELFGFDKWSYNVTRVEETKFGFMAIVKLYIGGGVEREDVGYTAFAPKRGEEPGPDDYDMAIKGAVSDALKRCLRTFGNQFGNSLYDKDRVPGPQQVTVDQDGVIIEPPTVKALASDPVNRLRMRVECEGHGMAGLTGIRAGGGILAAIPAAKAAPPGKRGLPSSDGMMHPRILPRPTPN